MEVENVLFACHKILRLRTSQISGNLEKKLDKDFTYKAKTTHCRGRMS